MNKSLKRVKVKVHPVTLGDRQIGVDGHRHGLAALSPHTTTVHLLDEAVRAPDPVYKDIQKGKFLLARFETWTHQPVASRCTDCTNRPP